MRNILIIIILLPFVTLNTFAKSNRSLRSEPTYIVGNFPKIGASEASLTYEYISDEGSVISANDIIFTNGEFAINININSPRWIIINLNNKNLFYDKSFSKMGIIVFPGDSLHFQINDYGISNLIASGQGAAKIKYVQELTHNIGNIKNPKSVFRLSNEERILRSHLMADISEETMKKFKELLTDSERRILLADAYCDAYGLLFYRLLKSDILTEEIPIIRKSIFQNENIEFLQKLTSDESNAVSGHLTLARELAYLQRKLSDITNYNPETSFKENYLLLKDFYSNNDFRDNLLSKFILTHTARKNIDDDVRWCINDFISFTDTESQIYQNFERSINEIDQRFEKGKDLINTSLEDLSGNKINLKDFQDKTVVIDFWFNGCVGCYVITPLLAETEHFFSDREDIIFVSISVDKQKESWLKGIGKFTPEKATHLYTNGDGKNNELIEYLKIAAFPTVVILDNKGRIFNARATRPYNKSQQNTLITEIINATKL